MSYLICLPSVYRPYTSECLATLSARGRANLMLIYNEETNIGVSASWNLALDEVLYRNLDWLILLSAAVRFGPAGGDDFFDRLDDPDLGVVEGGDGTTGGAMGWHVIGFHRSVLERVGRFDPQWFAYQEDVDYSWRLQLAYQPGVRAYQAHAVSTKLPVDARVASAAHSICLAHVQVDFVDNERRFAAKWLTQPYVDGVSYVNQPNRGPHLSHPYDNPDLDWTYTGPPLEREW